MRSEVKSPLSTNDQVSFCMALLIFKPDLTAGEAQAAYHSVFGMCMMGSIPRRARDMMRPPVAKTDQDREQWVRAYLTIFPESSATVVRRKCGLAFGIEMRQDVVDELRERELPRDEALAVLRRFPAYLREGSVRQPTLLDGDIGNGKV